MKYTLTKREKVLALVTAGVLVFALYYRLLFVPQLERNQQWSQKVTVQSSELNLLKIKLKALAPLEKEQEEGLLKVVRISDFLAFIADKAALAGLDVVSIVPQAEEAKEKSNLLEGRALQGKTSAPKQTQQGLRVEVQMKGTYLGLLEFLKTFEKGVVPAAAEGVDISKTEGQSDLSITVTFKASFYTGT